MTMHGSLLDLHDPLGVIIVLAGTIGTAWTFLLAARFTLWPGEDEPDHPKRGILRDDR
jgi:hypothetical protein